MSILLNGLSLLKTSSIWRIFNAKCSQSYFCRRKWGGTWIPTDRVSAKEKVVIVKMIAGLERDIANYHIPLRWIVFSAQSDWFVYLGISCTIHLRAKQDGVQFCFSYGRRKLFGINWAATPNSSKLVTKFGYKISRNMYFLYNLAINALRTCFKMFCLQTMSGRQADVP